MKDGGLGEGLPFPPSHLEKPVLNGLSDLLRLPQYPVLGVRAAASAGVRREGELYAHVRAGARAYRRVHRMDTNPGRVVVQGAFPAEEGRASAPLDARRRAGRAAAARGTAARGRRRCDIPRPSRAGTQVARRGCDTRGSARALAHKGARFLTPPPLCQFRVASINAKSPPPFAGKRAP